MTREYSHAVMNQSTHQIEPELLQAPPRKIKRHGGKIGDVWHDVGLFVVAGLILLAGVKTAQAAYFAGQAKYRGVTVPAVIVAHGTTSGRSGTRYHLNYRYMWQGHEYSNDAIVSKDNYAMLHNGATVQTRLWPPLPQRSSYLILPGLFETGSLFWFFANFLIVPLLIPPFLCVLLRKRRKQRCLLKRGVPVEARIVELVEGKHGSDVYYQFVTLTGDVRRNMDTVLVAVPQKNEILTALYDPHNPRRSMLYAFRDYDIAS